MIRSWLKRGLSGLERLMPRAAYLSTVPTDKRHWHDPSDPVQAGRIEAAKAKRDRRALKASLNAGRSTAGYIFCREAGLTFRQICTFDQLYVAK